MPTTELKLRRDVEADIDAMTPAEGEPIYDITKKRLRLGDGSTSGGIHMAAAADVQKQTFTYALVSGTDTLTASLTPALAAYTTGFKALIEIANNNTGAVTINFDALGAKTIKKNDGADDLEADDLVAGGLYPIAYDGTNMQLIGGVGSATGALLSVQVFTATGGNTWTKPAGVKSVRVQVVGAGGGGAREGSSAGAGGGGGGGYAEKFIDVTGTSSQTATVGAGGAGATSNNTAGSAGGTSSFGAFCSATGGAGGTADQAGGAGGAGSSGDVNVTGGGGVAGANSPDFAGAGGSSVLGGGAPGRRVSGVGAAGGAFGGGGGGGAGQQNAGAGADGVVIVWEYG